MKNRNFLRRTIVTFFEFAGSHPILTVVLVFLVCQTITYVFYYLAKMIKPEKSGIGKRPNECCKNASESVDAESTTSKRLRS